MFDMTAPGRPSIVSKTPELRLQLPRHGYPQRYRARSQRRARIDRLSRERAGPCRANFGGYVRINPFTPDVEHGRVERHRP